MTLNRGVFEMLPAVPYFPALPLGGPPTSGRKLVLRAPPYSMLRDPACMDAKRLALWSMRSKFIDMVADHQEQTRVADGNHGFAISGDRTGQDRTGQGCKAQERNGLRIGYRVVSWRRG